jgi:hypothetical protein
MAGTQALSQAKNKKKRETKRKNKNKDNTIDPPTTEQIQRVFPSLNEFQRIAFPIRIKEVTPTDWRSILELMSSPESFPIQSNPIV